MDIANQIHSNLQNRNLRYLNYHKKNKPSLKKNKRKLIKTSIFKAMLKSGRKQLSLKKNKGSKSKKTEKEIDIAVINSLSDF